MIKFKTGLILTIGLLCFFAPLLFGQNNGQTQIEMADSLRASGKIYVVVVVLSIIFAGIITFLVLIDRRLRKLEKE